ncbi:hypothetical protein quinque_016522, partial [Culex quinquefasciatus]|jgi:hypothetical protein
MLNKS